MFFYKLVHVDEIIRWRKNRHLFLVVNKVGENLFCIDLSDNIYPAPVVTITPRIQDEFDRDCEIEDLEKWEADTLVERVPHLVSFEEEHGTQSV